MMERDRQAAILVPFLAAAAGATTCLVAVIACYWASTGTTPAWVFERFGSLRHFRTGTGIAGIPGEFFGFVWFGGLALAAFAARFGSVLSAVCLFPSAVVLTGLAASRSWHYRLGNWPLNVITLASVALLLASASRRFPSRRILWTAVTAGVRGTTGRPGRCFALLGALCLTALAGVELRAAIRQVPPKDAAHRNFLNWYSSRPASKDTQLRHEGRIRVVVFCDYQCPACASSLPKVEALIRRLETRDRPLDLVIRDFPIDATCNPGYRRSPHPAACEAAAAARFVKARLGDAAGVEMAAWLYGQGQNLTPAVVADSLSARQVSEEFRAARREMLRLVSADAVHGLRLGVSSTPTFFVNGVKLPGPVHLEAAIRFEIERR